MAHEFDSVPADDAEVLGILAYSSLAFMTRLAKDGEQAPTFEAHVEHARMAARCFKLYQQLEVWSEHRGFDLLAAGDAFSGAYDDLDARTRPTTFAERAVKTFITRGMLGDMLIRVAQVHGLFEGIEDVWPFEQGHWVRAHLGPQIEADEQLSARLSLWGRRVAGGARCAVPLPVVGCVPGERRRDHGVRDQAPRGAHEGHSPEGLRPQV